MEQNKNIFQKRVSGRWTNIFYGILLILFSFPLGIGAFFIVELIMGNGGGFLSDVRNPNSVSLGSLAEIIGWAVFTFFFIGGIYSMIKPTKKIEG